MQFVFGATECDMQQPPFLSDRLRGRRPRHRDETSFESRDEDHRPLETFRTVEGCEVDALAARVVTAAGRRVEPAREASNTPDAALRREILTTELYEGVAVHARLVEFDGRLIACTAIGVITVIVGIL